MWQYSPDSSRLPALDDVQSLRVAVVKTQWNKNITDRLCASAVAVLTEAGLSENHVDVYEVPGAIELTYAASRLSEETYSAIIVIGCVIRGDTPHFDYVCSSVTQGITMINARGDVPVIFGVLTVDNEQQALDRCGGSCGDKGAEAAQTALTMVAFGDRLDRLHD